jgi:glycosyltransferase involved in cell wall biosynthesis
MSISNKYRTETMDVIVAAQAAYPDSRFLAAARARLLCECGFEEKALVACEEFLVRFGGDDEVLALALELRHKIGVHDQLNQAGTKSVSLCMIVKDEESCLARCLASAKPVVHELVVVDTGSSDRTVAIATVFGAKVSHFQWNGSFSDARNFGLDQAGGAWILVLDADEVISTRDHDRIRQLVLDAAGTKTAWRVLTRNYTIRHPSGWCANDGSYPAEERGGGWFPSSKVRLFRNSRCVRFSGVVHEMVEDDAEKDGYQFRDAPFVVHHYGRLYDDGEADFEKKTKYYELGLEKLVKSPNDLTALRELAIQAAELKRYDEAVELWDRFLALRPDTVIALFNKGYALMMQQHYLEALEVSRRVLDLEPAHKEAAFNYGSCELYVGDVHRAISCLKAILECHPGHPPLLALLMVLELAVAEVKAADQQFRQLQAQNYRIADYVQARVVTLEGVGRTELAKAIRTAAVSLGLEL